MLHLTVSNRPHPGLDLLLASTSRLPNVQTRVLGLGSKTPIGHTFRGFGLKLDLLKQELLLCPPLQPVLFTDAWDVVVQDSVTPLLEWLDSHPGKVLFAAESTKWPDPNLMYPIPLQFPFPYLNSGVCCGRAKDILRLLQIPFDTKTDDQGYYSEQFVKGSSIIELDHTAEFFLCMLDVPSSHLRLDKGVSFHGKRPIVIHLNNGLTRVKWFVPIVRSVLGDVFVPTARRVVWEQFVSMGLIAAPYVAALLVLVVLRSLWKRQWIRM